MKAEIFPALREPGTVRRSAGSVPKVHSHEVPVGTAAHRRSARRGWGTSDSESPHSRGVFSNIKSNDMREAESVRMHVWWEKIFGGPLRAIFIRALSIAASFLLTAVVARSLTINEAGTFFIVFTSVAVLATFCRFGTDNLLLKLCSREGAAPVRATVFATLIAVSATVVAFTLILLAMAVFPVKVDGVSSATLIFAVSAAAPQALSVMAGAVLRARGNLATGGLAELGSVPMLTLIVIPILAAFAEQSLESTLLSLGIGSWVTFAWSVPLACKVLYRAQAASSDDIHEISFMHFFRLNIRRLSSMMGASLLFFAIAWAPLYFLTAVNDLVGVSYFSVAMRLANFISLVPNLQISYLAPAFARKYQHNRIEELNALAGNSVKQAVLVLFIPVVIMIAGSGHIMIALFGRQYQEAGDMLVLLAIGAYFSVALGQVSQLMLLCDLESVALMLTFAAVSVWAIGGLPIATLYGSDAIAAISAGVNVAYSGMASWMLFRNKGIKSYLQLRKRAR